MRTLAPVLVAVTLLAGACSVASRQAGVQNVWREPGVMDEMKTGETTMGQVLDRLGPPSQLVELGDRTLFYYLLEQTDTDSLYLIVFNTSTSRVEYDRAVFLFDAGGVLREMSTSREKAPPPQKPAAEE